MNILKTILKSVHSVAQAPSTLSNGARLAQAKSSAKYFAAAFAIAATLIVGAVPQASAQTAPPYVVYSTTPLSGTGSTANAKANFGYFRAHAAVNSRGDFFIEDASGSVFEYPANGGTAILLWSVIGSTNLPAGTAGLAVDPFDNLYVSLFAYGGYNNTNSLLYEFPFTNGNYPSPFIYNTGAAQPGSCTPASAATASAPAIMANTGVCTVGFFTGANNYYWQGPLDVAADGQGNNYTISGYNNQDGGDGTIITLCAISCAEQLVGNGASDYAVALPHSLQSLASDYAGDLYMADDTNVSLIPAGSPATKNVPAIFDSTYSTPYGVSFDASGNLYVTDTVGIWEVPAVEASGAPCQGGTDKCTITATSKYLLIPVATAGAGLYYPSYNVPAIDNRGNIVFSPSSGNLVKYGLWSGAFPAAQIGATGSTILTFTISFNSATTIATLQAVQGSVPSSEFAITPGSCTAGTAFAAKATCTFTATFTPSGLGARSAAVVVTDTTGRSTYTYLSGTGTGTAVTVDPGTPTQIATGFKKAAGVALDAAGNVYIADSAANKVQEYPAGGGTAVSIGTALNVPTGVTVDAAGNVYIVNQGTGATGGTIVEVPNIAGVLTASAQKTLVTGLNLPTDIVIDSEANLYVSVTGGNQVLQLANASRDNASAARIVRGYGLSAPTGLALDTSNNLYVADTGNNRVVQIGEGSVASIGSGLSAPTGVTTDPSGAVIIVDGTGRIIRVPNETYGVGALGLNQADQQVLASPLSFPYSIRTDSQGNLYVSDNNAEVLDKLQRTTGVVNFGNWNVNTVSDAQTIVLSNSGTADVTVGNPPFAAVPASSEFVVNAGSSSQACGAGLFHSGYQCTVLATFKPTASGQVTYPLVFNAPTQTAASATVNLSGAGTTSGVDTIKLVQTSPTTSTISYGQPIVFTVTVAPTSSTTVPTGYVVFEFNGQGQRPVLLNATGSASITLNGLNAGNNTLSAYYEGDANYADIDSAVVPVNILQATEAIVFTAVGDSAVPLSVQPADTLTLTETLMPSVVGSFGGTVNFIDVASNTVLNPTPISVGSPDPKTGLYTVSYAFQPSSQAPISATTFPASFNVVAVFTGNVDYAPITSQVIPYIVIKTGYGITQDVTSVTATKTAPGIVNLLVTDYSAFYGSVSLQCSGLPANTYCVFRPASAQLIPAVSQVLQNTQLVPLTFFPVPVQLQIMVDQSAIPIEGSVYWLSALVLGMALAWHRKLTAGKFSLPLLLAVLCIAGLTSLSGCGSSSGNAFPTPTGAYPVTITATSTPVASGGGEPPCVAASQTCTSPPTAGPSINVIETVSVNLTVK